MASPAVEQGPEEVTQRVVHLRGLQDLRQRARSEHAHVLARRHRAPLGPELELLGPRGVLLHVRARELARLLPGRGEPLAAQLGRGALLEDPALPDADLAEQRVHDLVVGQDLEDVVEERAAGLVPGTQLALVEEREHRIAERSEELAALVGQVGQGALAAVPGLVGLCGRRPLAIASAPVLQTAASGAVIGDEAQDGLVDRGALTVELLGVAPLRQLLERRHELLVHQPLARRRERVRGGRTSDLQRAAREAHGEDPRAREARLAPPPSGTPFETTLERSVALKSRERDGPRSHLGRYAVHLSSPDPVHACVGGEDVTVRAVDAVRARNASLRSLEAARLERTVSAKPVHAS